MDIKRIIINKNRGWRGLAEVRCYNSEHKDVKTMVFSFSPAVWTDMLKGHIVIQDSEHYYILQFDNTDALPKGQRSVLIKTFNANVTHIYQFTKENWRKETPTREYYTLIDNFLKNRNNHTTSDWNCIGIRVVPVI